MNINKNNINLRWDQFQMNIPSAFQNVRSSSDYSDVTLVTEDECTVEAHRVILAAGSKFFQTILGRTSALKHPHPVMYLRGVSSAELNSLLDFLYTGETSVDQRNLASFLDITKQLGVKGLVEDDDVVKFENSKLQDLETICEENYLISENFKINPNINTIVECAAPTSPSPPISPDPTAPLPLDNHHVSLMSNNPLMTGRSWPLSPDDALRLLTEPNRYTTDLKDFARANGGEVFIYISQDFITSRELTQTGHRFVVRNGVDKVHAKNNTDQHIFKKVAFLVTQEQKGGCKGFKRYSWQLEERSKIILLQFVGDSSLSEPVIHGNSKYQPKI